MICISVTPKSRRFAKADLLNAARQCDLVELCLDHLLKEPDISDLLSAVDRPILISCRREEDGGQWVGSEEDRLRLLRQAIVSGPAYVELELDVAENIRRYGKTKRVISYTSLREPISNADEIYYRAQSADADVVKFSWPTRTLDATWPLLSAVTKHSAPPIVGTGLGRAGLMFSLLGLKYGSPWIYAALEKGMEAYPGQPTITELKELYGWEGIDPKTRFVGICGFGESETKTVRVLNAAFDALQLNGRCLPLAWGRSASFGKMLEALKIKTLIVTPALSAQMVEFADEAEEAVRSSGYCDLLVRREGKWHAYNTLGRSVLKRTENALAEQKTTAGERPLDRRSTLIIGADERAQAIAWGFSRREGVLSISDPDDAAAAGIARRFGLRHVPFAAVYESFADVIVMTDPAIPVGHRKSELNPSILRPSTTLVDLSRLPEETEFVREGRERGCRVVAPGQIFADVIRTQFLAATGKELPAEVFNRQHSP